jgi:hypothetical protein
VAVPVFIRDRSEDVGVVTAAACRGRGLSPVCAARMSADFHIRHRTASSSTAPGTTASLRTAEKLGFVKPRDDVRFVAGPPLPEMIAASAAPRTCPMEK